MMSDPVPESKRPERKVYLLGVLGLTVFPLLLGAVGFVVSRALWGAVWLVAFLVWCALGLGAGVPVLIAGRRHVRGSDARYYGTVLGVLGSIAGLVAAATGFVLAGLGGAHG
jgi:MFS family permease